MPLPVAKTRLPFLVFRAGRLESPVRTSSRRNNLKLIRGRPGNLTDAKDEIFQRPWQPCSTWRLSRRRSADRVLERAGEDPSDLTKRKILIQPQARSRHQPLCHVHALPRRVEPTHLHSAAAEPRWRCATSLRQQSPATSLHDGPRPDGKEAHARHAHPTPKGTCGREAPARDRRGCADADAQPYQASPGSSVTHFHATYAEAKRDGLAAEAELSHVDGLWQARCGIGRACCVASTDRKHGAPHETPRKPFHPSDFLGSSLTDAKPQEEYTPGLEGGKLDD